MPKIVIEHATKELEELEDQSVSLKGDIAKLKQKLVDPEVEKITIEQFLNLSKNAGTAIEAGNSVIKDMICRFIFLNFTVDEEKVVSYQLKPPFDTLLKTRVVNSNRDEDTKLELSKLYSILTNHSFVISEYISKSQDINVNEELVYTSKYFVL